MIVNILIYTHRPKAGWVELLHSSSQNNIFLLPARRTVQPVTQWAALGMASEIASEPQSVTQWATALGMA